MPYEQRIARNRSVSKSPAPAHTALSTTSSSMSEPTTIIVPSTPTAGVASIPSFSATISPKAFSVEARLDLSLDDLIKERRKEVKKEKHESVKKETTTQKKKKESDLAAKSTQSVKRNALVNKNRGLPALPATPAKAGEGTSKSALRRHKKKKNASVSQTVVTKKAAPASKQNAQKLTIVAPKANAKFRNDGRKVTSPKPKANQQQTRKSNKKVVQQQQQQQSKSNKPNKSVKTLTVVTKDQARKVVRSEGKAAKIRITIKQTQAAKKQSNNASKKTKQQQKTRIMNVVLPGKVASNYSRSSSAASRAQQVVKRVQNRKQSSSKNGAFVVRKPFMSRKN